MSGAGTSTPGLKNPFFINSNENFRVIFSNSNSEYFLGSIRIPALAPPYGTSTAAHLNVIIADRARTSSAFTPFEYLNPPTS